jgi:hypothetical protein
MVPVLGQPGVAAWGAEVFSALSFLQVDGGAARMRFSARSKMDVESACVFCEHHYVICIFLVDNWPSAVY